MKRWEFLGLRSRTPKTGAASRRANQVLDWDPYQCLSVLAWPVQGGQGKFQLLLPLFPNELEYSWRTAVSLRYGCSSLRQRKSSKPCYLMFFLTPAHQYTKLIYYQRLSVQKYQGPLLSSAQSFATCFQCQASPSHLCRPQWESHLGSHQERRPTRQAAGGKHRPSLGNTSP